MANIFFREHCREGTVSNRPILNLIPCLYLELSSRGRVTRQMLQEMWGNFDWIQPSKHWGATLTTNWSRWLNLCGEKPASMFADNLTGPCAFPISPFSSPCVLSVNVCVCVRVCVCGSLCVCCSSVNLPLETRRLRQPKSFSVLVGYTWKG